MLMSCCEDGSICLWRSGDDGNKAVQHLGTSAKLRLEEGELAVECLVLRADWENKCHMLGNTVRQLDDVKRQAELRIKAVEHECAEKVFGVESRHLDQFDRAIDKIQVILIQLTIRNTFNFTFKFKGIGEKTG